ncbi:MAG: hypothetical protein LBD07_02080 [Spirochaetaceae bacterium]|jgi:hypothetical protein|nr:hypothetical protein [Spirochaetaceae bacterium]
MRIKITAFSLFFLLTAVFVISCKSTPKSVAAGEDKIAVDYDKLGSLIAEAKEKRQEINDNELEILDEPLVSKADDCLISAENIYNKGTSKLSNNDKKSAYKDAEFALLTYAGLLDTYWYNTSSEARQRASTAQQDALKLKADVAVRNDYNLSTEIFNNGEQAYKDKDYKRALSFYLEATMLFVNAASNTAEKKRLAMLALQSAETKILESEKIAADAEAVLNTENTDNNESGNNK